MENKLNNYGIVAVPLNTITSEQLKNTLNKTKFYSTANDMLKIPVEEPTLEEKINPRLFKKRDVPDAHVRVHTSIFYSCSSFNSYGRNF